MSPTRKGEYVHDARLIAGMNHTSKADRCLGCGSSSTIVLHEVRGVPANCGLLMPTRESAINCRRGDIRLGFCRSCTLISNLAFDPALLEYSSSYDETQSFSRTFHGFQRGMAERLIERHCLRQKDVMEIGCGNGEFLGLLCELGANRGTGFDPAFVEGRAVLAPGLSIQVVKDFYSHQYSGYKVDFVCCNMTLEHIYSPTVFVENFRCALRPDAVAFFLLPDAARILAEIAFWDVYYEHCSYYTKSALHHLFERCGFKVVAISSEYEDQYLSIEARQSDSVGLFKAPVAPRTLRRLEKKAEFFRDCCEQEISSWRSTIRAAHQAGRRIAIWGGGSKAVAFLTSLGVQKEVECVVDINPRRHNTFVAGSGHQIVAPASLPEYRPDVVIVMNPIYRKEISQSLDEMALQPELLTL